MTDTAYLNLEITAELCARLQHATPAHGPFLFGAIPSPLSGITDLAVRAACDRALRADLAVHADAEQQVNGAAEVDQSGLGDREVVHHHPEEP